MSMKKVVMMNLYLRTVVKLVKRPCSPVIG